MYFNAFKIFGQQIKQPKVLNNHAVNVCINQFIQQAYEGRDFIFQNNDIEG